MKKKLYLILLLGSLGSFQIQAQRCDPDNAATLSLPSITESNVLQKLQAVRPEYNAADVKAIKETLNKCNAEMEAELSRIQTQLSDASLKYQEILSVKDISKLEEQIKARQDSRTQSQAELERNLAGVKHTGIFIVLLQGIDIYADKNELVKQSQDALAPQVVQSLNGTQISRLTSVSNLKEVKDIIQSFTGGDMSIADVLADKPLYTKKVFLYAAKVNVTPLKNKQINTLKLANGATARVIDVLNESNWEDELTSIGVSNELISELNMKISGQARRINNENFEADRSQESIAQRGAEEIAKIDEEIKELRSKINIAKQKVQGVLKSLGQSYNENDVAGSIQKALNAQLKIMDNLRQEWNTVKGREYLWKPALIEINGNPFASMAPEVIRLVKLLNDTYGTIKKSAELTKVEDMIVTDYQAFLKTEAYREVDKIWIYPVGQDDGTFQLTLIARFKINTKTPNSTSVSTPTYTNISTNSSYTEYGITPSFKMIAIPAGTFTMGCTSEQQDCEDNENPTHQVTLSSFYMGEAEVTVAEFKMFISETAYQTDADKNGGSYIWNGSESELISGVNWRNDITGKNLQADNHPVIHVSWNDVTAYIAWLNKKCGRQYRLPTEAEWEYAAREGGKAVMFGNGKNILNPAEANFYSKEDYKKSYSVIGTYREKTTAVKTFKPNSLGLYDMTGNVNEWCSDWYGNYNSNSQTNPTGASSGTCRVIRGGSWDYYPQYCRLAYRNCITPGRRRYSIGFRLVSSQ